VVSSLCLAPKKHGTIRPVIKLRHFKMGALESAVRLMRPDNCFLPRYIGSDVFLFLKSNVANKLHRVKR
jgi:hypothetical protein